MHVESSRVLIITAPDDAAQRASHQHIIACSMQDARRRIESLDTRCSSFGGAAPSPWPKAHPPIEPVHPNSTGLSQRLTSRHSLLRAPTVSSLDVLSIHHNHAI